MGSANYPDSICGLSDRMDEASLSQPLGKNWSIFADNAGTRCRIVNLQVLKKMVYRPGKIGNILGQLTFSYLGMYV